MAVISASFRGIAGTQASVGTVDGKSVIVDRPAGTAGGMGLGLNGGQLLALAVGGCLCNDLRYVAHDARVDLGDFTLDVAATVGDGKISGIEVRVQPSGDRRPFEELLDQAVAASTIVDAVVSGAPVTVRLA